MAGIGISSQFSGKFAQSTILRVAYCESNSSDCGVKHMDVGEILFQIGIMPGKLVLSHHQELAVTAASSTLIPSHVQTILYPKFNLQHQPAHLRSHRGPRGLPPTNEKKMSNSSSPDLFLSSKCIKTRFRPGLHPGLREGNLRRSPGA